MQQSEVGFAIQQTMPETSIATYFFMLDILFEYMNLDLTIFDVRKKIHMYGNCIKWQVQSR